MRVRIESTFGSTVGKAVQRTDTASDGLSEKDALAIVVGDRFSTYLHYWRLYEASGRAPRRWNWPAFLFSSLWFFFRRMHAWGALWFILSPLMMTAFVLMGLPWLSLLSFVVFRVLAGILANPLYLAHCRRIVRKVDAEHRGAHRRHLELQKAGGVSYTALVIALAVTASQNTLINLIVRSISEPTPTQSAVYVAANRPDLPDPQIEEAERVVYQEQMRAIAMTAWPAGVPTEGNACIVELRLAPPGQVMEANALEPCTLNDAQREMMLGEIKRMDFTIEGKMRFFNRHTLIDLHK